MLVRPAKQNLPNHIAKNAANQYLQLDLIMKVIKKVLITRNSKIKFQDKNPRYYKTLFWCIDRIIKVLMIILIVGGLIASIINGMVSIENYYDNSNNEFNFLIFIVNFIPYVLYAIGAKAISMILELVTYTVDKSYETAANTYAIMKMTEKNSDK